MGAAIFKYTGALDQQYHARLYIERPEDIAVRQALERVGTECTLISLIGARQTGKTSLLNRLHATCSDLSVWVAIKIDLSILSEAQGEAWYQQLIAICCERFQQRSITLSVNDLQDHCLSLYIPPFSARGWAELLRLVCQRLTDSQCLLISLDEISSVPRQQWEPFFSNIRAIHQAASSPDDRPEYRKMGMILAGAFVPAQLISVVEKSPFNVSIKVYMSAINREQLQPLTQLLINEGVTLEADAIEAVYRWSGGLLYHIQRFYAEITNVHERPITTSGVDSLANIIAFDDAYLSHILRSLKASEILARFIRRIMAKPLRSDRTVDAIATLEIMGVISHDPITNEWKIANLLCEHCLKQHLFLEDQPVEQRLSEQVNETALRQLLTTHFNDSELRDLCFDLAIDYESLPGQGKGDKARELILHVKRRGDLNDLVTRLRVLRPQADWQHVIQTIPSE